MIEAAEMIHTDLAKKFIKAGVIDWQELVKLGGWSRAKEKGKVNIVGKDHLVRGGEVIEIIAS